MPIDVLETVDLGEEYREQIQQYFAVTRYFRYGGNEGVKYPITWNRHPSSGLTLPTGMCLPPKMAEFNGSVTACGSVNQPRHWT